MVYKNCRLGVLVDERSDETGIYAHADTHSMDKADWLGLLARGILLVGVFHVVSEFLFLSFSFPGHERLLDSETQMSIVHGAGELDKVYNGQEEYRPVVDLHVIKNTYDTCMSLKFSRIVLHGKFCKINRQRKERK